MARPRIGFAAMLDRFAPAEAVALAEHAEQRGFSGVLATDHVQPWLPQHGEASFVWSVLGALGQRTHGDLGPAAVTPGPRLHPVTLAQAAATLESLYPGRHWVGLGAGEALNEHVTGAYWPEAPERINRLFEALEVVRKLFAAGAAGRDVRHTGAHFRLEASRLWTVPATPPPLYVATAGPITAKRAGRHADGLVTVSAAPERVAHLLDRFAAGAKDAGRRGERLPVVLHVHLSWAPTEAEALENALREWPNGAMRFPKSDLRSPFDVEQIARLVRPEDFEGRMLVSSDPDAHRALLQRYLDLGVDRLYLHNAGRDQRSFLDVFGRDVLPSLVR